MFASAQALLREDLREWLARVQAAYAWGADAGIALTALGKLLPEGPAPSIRLPAGFWALLPYFIASYCSEALQEDALRIRRLAVACELLLCSLDYFDELEDDDPSEVRSALGDGRLLNCATALLMEGLQVLAELDVTAQTSTPHPRLFEMASEELRQAMSGQHMDLLAEQRELSGFDTDEAEAIASAKAGRLCRMVCRLAAAVGGASDEIAALFAEIGTHVGVASQIENDLHDLEGELRAAGAPSPSKSDRARSKKTLPLVLLAQSPLQETAPSADTPVYESQERPPYRDAFQQALGGAIAHRLAAAALVERIEQLRGAAFPQELRVILGTDADAL